MSAAILLCLALISVMSSTALAADLEREARLRAEIEDMIVVGDPVYLEANGRAFLAIYTEAEQSPALGSVLLLHGRGYHPDWPRVVQPLRTVLPERGWNTLSIQLPVLEKDAKYYDYVPIFPEVFPRLRAAFDYLRERNQGPVVMIAHSCGVHMAMAYVEEHGDADFDGYVGIGMGATDYGQPMDHRFPLEALAVPVLDIFGEEDYPGVRRMAPSRLLAMSGEGRGSSRQVQIAGADHDYATESATARLLEEVSAWLAGTQFNRLPARSP